MTRNISVATGMLRAPSAYIYFFNQLISTRKEEDMLWLWILGTYILGLLCYLILGCVVQFILNLIGEILEWINGTSKWN